MSLLLHHSCPSSFYPKAQYSFIVVSCPAFPFYKLNTPVFFSLSPQLLQPNSLVAQMIKNPLSMQETWVWPWVGKTPWRGAWQPTRVFLPGEFHGQRSLAGYSPWGCKELDMTKWLTLPFFINRSHAVSQAPNMETEFTSVKTLRHLHFIEE